MPLRISARRLPASACCTPSAARHLRALPASVQETFVGVPGSRTPEGMLLSHSIHGHQHRRTHRSIAVQRPDLPHMATGSVPPTGVFEASPPGPPARLSTLRTRRARKTRLPGRRVHPGVGFVCSLFLSFPHSHLLSPAGFCRRCRQIANSAKGEKSGFREFSARFLNL
jgi:hypothetical protein